MSASVTFLSCPKLVIIVVALSALYSAVQCCSQPSGPQEELTQVEKVQGSKFILTAIVTSTRPDPRFPGHNVYFADLEVKCIYKGPQLEEKITVAEAGQVPGLCLSTNLTVSTSYIFYLNPDGEQFKQRYAPDTDDEQYIDEITVVCGVYLNYPKGYTSANKKHFCTELADNVEDCIGETSPEPEVDEAKYNSVGSDTGNSGSDPGNSGQTLFLCWSCIISFISAMFVL